MRRALPLAILLLGAPATAQPVPEPLVFDLVLAHGPTRGELEANAIVFVPTDGSTPSWTPEVEGSPFDGVGVELELPYVGDRLTGFNLGAQYTLPGLAGGRFVHAVQGRFERSDEDGNDLIGLYVPGFRFDETWSVLFMVGVRGKLGSEREEDLKVLVNAALFAELGAWTLGVETNSSETLRRTESFGLIPQVHWDVTEHFGLLLGYRWLAEERLKSELALRAFYAF